LMISLLPESMSLKRWTKYASIVDTATRVIKPPMWEPKNSIGLVTLVSGLCRWKKVFCGTLKMSIFFRKSNLFLGFFVKDDDDFL
jgi:hypothetical protein